MAERKWTQEQSDAIHARGGTLLVSAAAGSGKTAVLVERVIRRITDEEIPCDVDRLLIVTFTKAAAAEMRERIDTALTEKRRERPNDTRLLRQQMLLPRASICTIDSFCNDLVRENFFQLDIPPDFQILDTGELCLLQERAVDAVLEEMYAQNSSEFQRLVELMSGGRDDGALSSAITTLYTYVTAHPFPQVWLNQMAEMYQPGCPVEESLWGKTLLDYAQSALLSCKESLSTAVNAMTEDETLLNAYAAALSDGIRQLEKLYGFAASGEWDALVSALPVFAFEKFKPVRGYKDNPLKQAVTFRRDEVKKQITKLSEIFSISRQEHREDMEALYPVVKTLCSCVNCYGEKLSELKKQRRALDFSDIEHLALKLLVKQTKDGYTRTAAAQELSLRYDEVLVDEYQDTNETQDLLFRSISQNENNLFFVGDVKQSIYRFRQAMPEIFLRRRDSLPVYKNGILPARIILGRNFRSRRGVTQAVNYIFSQLMSKDIGELDYDENEALVCGADYKEQPEPEYELHVIDSRDGEENLEKDALEARYIASRIRQMMDEGLTVRDGAGERKASYRDFCILLRSANAHAKNYVKELQNQEIPAWADLSGGFFGAQEVSVMLSYLRIIDNPMQDIAFLSVMMSPIYGFTPDDLAELRIRHRKIPLYLAVMRASRDGEEKYNGLLEDLHYLRCMSSALPSDELIRRIYERTGYTCIVLAMKNPEQRQANLNLLLEYARAYEKNGYKGLSSFIRFIGNVERRDQDLSPASALSEGADVVRIMSIHRSKGLEFPVCILAGCGSQFNASSRMGNLLLHPRFGIGVKRQEEQSLRKFNTAAYEAVRLETERAELSEELRVLYVAATRARERLLAVMTVSNPEKRLAGLTAEISGKEKLRPFTVRRARGYSDWLLLCALRHPDGEILRETAGVGNEIVLPADFSMKVFYRCKAEVQHVQTQFIQDTAPNQELRAEIEKRLTYTYPFTALRGILAKRGASELSHGDLEWEYFAGSRPAFLEKQGLTPAQKGTALHKFMQFASYQDARTQPQKELNRLVAGRWLSPEEGGAVDLERVEKFFSSALAERIFAGSGVYRELKFTIEYPAWAIEPSLTGSCAEETVLVQGIADCVFIEDGQAVILDYKTDRIRTLEELAGRYAPQLAIYRYAVEKCLDLPVKECILYSFYLNGWIRTDI